MLAEPDPVLNRQSIRRRVARDPPSHLASTGPTRGTPLAHAAAVAKARFARANLIRNATAGGLSEPIATGETQRVVLRGVFRELECNARRPGLVHYVVGGGVHRSSGAAVTGSIDVSLAGSRATDVVESAERIVHEADGIGANGNRPRKQ